MTTPSSTSRSRARVPAGRRIGSPSPITAFPNLAKSDRSVRIGDALLVAVVAVVQPDADDLAGTRNGRGRPEQARGTSSRPGQLDAVRSASVPGRRPRERPDRDRQGPARPAAASASWRSGMPPGSPRRGSRERTRRTAPASSSPARRRCSRSLDRPPCRASQGQDPTPHEGGEGRRHLVEAGSNEVLAGRPGRTRDLREFAAKVAQCLLRLVGQPRVAGIAAIEDDQRAMLEVVDPALGTRGVDWDQTPGRGSARCSAGC